MTPHINAKKDDIAKVVLMPGDPLRAKWIAEQFMEKPRLVNEVRGMLAFTGQYKGKTITIMGHGMGIPSIGIYSYELMKFYEVNTIIRIGSCGALQDSLNLQDLIIAAKAWSESIYANDMGVEVPADKILMASPQLVELAKKTANQLQLAFHEGLVFCEDAFHQTRKDVLKLAQEKHALAVEMEAHALYANAMLLNKQALTMLTVSDSLVTHAALPAEQRQATFKNMAILSLEMASQLV
ncbi:purine-nucleoside phosphorylase [Mycoplasmoides pneumoniae]|uniref:Uridine phosphorylase n=3 Tax=Mycoplasmoides pneumoniae TaxID=2104 RepID=A0AAV5N7K0_MYCPM|nr:purine-nucleoside phosphorylase [Mycoplasmoides pneumoniae]ADK86845.1 purine nucleoside phosphorylase [Mycoplasmoides pneumoniae FH]ALA30910.1 purine nucleoside phosphorylase DeoD-type [Mycoplasmoides pneumoniae 19294]ALA31346.1 purine nucleoside phosphorylase DeoD-type [Mycoplasmoides pneumoniae 39443]ALA35578.1 purine nucleoside phosphorylase DeoD-type [Mycoplasmoides pneumoniae FH]ALA36284.1 purine nucleoside phosphorylase DeoD-type [Mycoplasmoides pneumoniae M1139]